jgi:Domain of unknown function (DUF4402)
MWAAVAAIATACLPWRRYSRAVKWLLFLLAALIAATPARAQQCLACDARDAPSSRSERPVRVTITANLDFSRVTTRSGGSGSLSIDPVTGAAIPYGSVSAIGGMAFSGRALVEGEPNRAVRVTLPEEILLTSTSGGTVRVRRLVTSLSAAPMLGPDGRLDFAFGGELEVQGGVSGEFRGRVSITVDYD